MIRMRMSGKSTCLTKGPWTAFWSAAVVLCLLSAGCSKVEKLEQAVVDRTASKIAANAQEAIAAEKKTQASQEAAKAAEKAKFDKAVANAVDKVVSKREAEHKAAVASVAADHAAALELAEAAKKADAPNTTGFADDQAKDPTADLDAEALAMLAEVRACKRVERRQCKPFAALEKRCKAAWRTRSPKTRTYDVLWRSLFHVIATSKNENERYAATYLATFRCRPSAAIQANESIGRTLLDALRREPKGSKAGPRIAELLSGWWAAELPKLHTDMGQLLRESAHPDPAARAEFVRVSNRYASKRAVIGEMLIQIATAPKDHVDVRTEAIRGLPKLVGTRSADEALSVLAQLALDRPGALTVEAFGALGDSAALTHWPALVNHWRKSSGQAIVGAAMARATWRYAVAKYSNETRSLAVRVAAFDTAVEVLAETTTPSAQRALAILGMQHGGHPNAQPVLERIAAGNDRVLAAAATKALKRLKAPDPAFSALVEPLPRAKVARPGRASTNSARAPNSARPPTQRRAIAPSKGVARPRAGRPGR